MQKGKYPQKSYQEYISRINRSIDYIQINISKELNLEIIAKEACFSPFHFHRIFRAIVGETLNSFVKRVRVEKSAFFVKYNSDLSMTDIALKSGFSSSQSFARAFKEYFKMSPSEYQKNSKNCNIESKNGKDFKLEIDYASLDGRPNLIFQSLISKNMKVEVKKLPEMSVAYVRHIGDYKGNSKLFEKLFGKLCGWAGPRGLIGKDSKFLSIYYDDPKVTDGDKLRLDVCMTVPEIIEVSGEINKQTLASGEYAVARFELKEPKDYETAWTSVYQDWLPQSGYQPDDRPAYEIYQNDPKEHPEGLHIVDICVPVKAL